MKSLLEINSPTRGRATDPSFIYIEETVKKYTTQLKYRINNLNRFVNKDHLLYKLLTLSLESMPFLPEDDQSLFFDARRSIRGIATSLKLSYINNYGSLHNGAIIPNTKEAIVITAKMNNKPVSILYHNHYNLNWDLGNDNFKEGIAFIELNIYAILKEYYNWRIMNSQEDDLFNFIYKKLIYSCIDDYMDIALFNRHIYTRENTSMPAPPPVREYKIPNLEDRFDKHVRIVGKIQDSKRLNVSGFLDHIELFHRESAKELIPSYPDYTTHQVRWVYTFSTLPYITAALKYAATSKGNKREINRKFIGQLKRFVRNFKNQNPISPLPSLDQERLQEILNSLDQTLSHY